MAITGPIGCGEDEDAVLSTINTTPLVDVMLVLLIIFLITVPVAIQTVPVQLPKEANQATQSAPQTVTIAVDRDGRIFWDDREVPDRDALLDRLKAAAVQTPQPEVHIRGDREARYEAVGRVVTTCRSAGIAKVGFITEPPHGS
jgi:biopolymer transport protein ExbD